MTKKHPSKLALFRCDKCSHIGKPTENIKVVTGCGNKKIRTCAKCNHLFEIIDVIPNKQELTDNAPKML